MDAIFGVYMSSWLIFMVVSFISRNQFGTEVPVVYPLIMVYRSAVILVSFHTIKLWKEMIEIENPG